MQRPCQNILIYIFQVFDWDSRQGRRAFVKKPTMPTALAQNGAPNRDWHASCTLLGKPIGPKEINLVPQNSRSEEHTSELQSLMRISYAVFCLKKKKQQNNDDQT